MSIVCHIVAIVLLIALLIVIFVACFFIYVSIVTDIIDTQYDGDVDAYYADRLKHGDDFYNKHPFNI